MTESTPQVREVETCNVRKSGLVFLVDGHLSVREGHSIAHEVKDALLASDLAVLDVVVHVE